MIDCRRQSLSALVAASYLWTSTVPSAGFAQDTSLFGVSEPAAQDCDLTGQWRSTRGPMQLVFALVRPASGIVIGAADLGAVGDGPGIAVVTGSFRAAVGAMQLDGTVIGNRVDLRWYPGDAGSDAASGDGYFDIADDCDSLTGAYRTGSEGDFGEVWTAERIGFTAAAGDAAALQATLARVDEGMAAIQALRDSLPRAEFDVAARADALPDSVDAIHGYVRDGIAFEAYQGVLRGARGALIARAGNAADQSLLLAALLRAHGHRVRFAVGTLGAAAAAQLVDGMRPPDAATPLVEPDDALRARLLAVAGSTAEAQDAAAAPRQAARAALLAAVANDAADYGEQIAALLDGAGLRLAVDPAAERDGLIARSLPHIWVQVEDGDQWRDLDPLAAGPPGATLAAAEATYDALPDALYHTVSFRVTIERLEGGALAEEQAAGWQVRLADLVDLGLPGIWIGNVPLDAPEALAGQSAFEDLGELSASLAPERMLAARRFQPTLALSTGELQAGTGFDLRGHLVAGDWRVGAAAMVADTVSGGLSGAIGTLDNLFGDADQPEATATAAPALTAQWIDYEVSGPGIDSRSQRRFVLDRIGPAARAAGIAALPETAPDDDAARMALATVNEIMVGAGALSEAFGLDVMLAAFQQNRGMLEQLAALAAGTQPADADFYEQARFYPNKLLILMLLEQEQARLAAERAGVHAYADSGSITVRQLTIWQADGGGFGGGQTIDLVDVSRRVAAREGLPADTLAGFQRNFGTALTSLEHQMLGWIGRADCPGCGEQPVIGTTAVMEAANAAGMPLRVLTADNADAVPAAIGADDRRRIADTLATGYWVIVPDAPVDLAGAAMTAWWRIDPATGAVLGMTALGGSDFVEYLAFIIFFGWAPVLGFSMGFLGCTGLGGSPGTGKLVGCILCGVITAICLELLFLATEGVGLIAASSTCGLGSTVGGVATCGVSGML